MSEKNKRRWFRFAYSLPALFVFVTIVGFYLGVQRKRIGQRHEFLAAESAILELHGVRHPNTRRERGVGAPWPLGLFGKEWQSVVEFYADGADRDHMTTDDWKKAIKAQRLFPESEVKAFHESGRPRGFRFWMVNSLRYLTAPTP